MQISLFQFLNFDQQKFLTHRLVFNEAASGQPQSASSLPEWVGPANREKMEALGLTLEIREGLSPTAYLLKEGKQVQRVTLNAGPNSYGALLERAIREYEEASAKGIQLISDSVLGEIRPLNLPRQSEPFTPKTLDAGTQAEMEALGLTLEKQTGGNPLTPTFYLIRNNEVVGQFSRGASPTPLKDHIVKAVSKYKETL